MQWTPAAAFVTLSAAGLALGLGACSDGDARSDGRYCTEVGDHLTELNTTAFGTSTDIDIVVAAWRTVSRHAPLSIQPEWESLVAQMEFAAKVDPQDAEAVQRLVDLARRNEPSANAVIDYTQRICGVTIGDVAPVTTVPNPTAPATSAGAGTTTTTG